METFCKHPKVRVVAREEDAEYVECQECGEVFDSDEFRDMAIESEGLEDDRGLGQERAVGANSALRVQDRIGSDRHAEPSGDPPCVMKPGNNCKDCGCEQ